MGSGKGGRGGEAVKHRPHELKMAQGNVPATGKSRRITPRGLKNVGNTCYSNSVLQCLLSTALSDALLHPKAALVFRRYSWNHKLLVDGSGSVDSEESSLGDSCGRSNRELRREQRREQRRKEREDHRMQETCEWLTRELTEITREYVRASKRSKKKKKDEAPLWNNFFVTTPLKGTAPVVDPGTITRHPNRLSKCLTPYQQEDAHEFLRSLLTTLAMNGHNKKLSSLFDGLLESAVSCQTCQNSSVTRDRYMDLSLDIHNAKTLPEALEQFTRTEVLDGDNRVMCDKCNLKRDVTKGLRLATAPSILVCHLKRFAFDRYGRSSRLNNHVRFPLRLEIGDYMSRANKAKPPPYELVGVLVHMGRTCDSGHYIAYIKSGKEWFKANDSVVTPVEVDVVLSQKAYVLFYEVAEMRKNEGFTTPHANRQPHPNLSKTKHSNSDDNSVPSYTSTVVSDEEEDDPVKCLSFFSMMMQGDLCCQPSTSALDNETKTMPMKHPTDVSVRVVSQDQDTGTDDSTLEESIEGSIETVKKRQHMRKSNSSSDIQELVNQATTAYHHSYRPRKKPIHTRSQSFGRQVDNRAIHPPSPGCNSKRRSSSQPRRGDKLPPRPLPTRGHSSVSSEALAALQLLS